MKVKAKKPIKPKRPNQMSPAELRRKYGCWMKNLIYGIQQIMELPEQTQQCLWFCVLQETIYNPTTDRIK